MSKNSPSVRPLSRSFEVDDPAGGVGVKPGETAPLGHERSGLGVLTLERRADPDAVRNDPLLPVHEDDKVRMDVKRHSLHPFALDSVNTLVRSRDRRRLGQQWHSFRDRHQLGAEVARVGRRPQVAED